VTFANIMLHCLKAKGRGTVATLPKCHAMN
jgi:hypothetical protein